MTPASNSPRHTSRIPWRWLLAVYWLMLFAGTHWPTWATTTRVTVSDKLMHFTAYAGLALLMALAVRRSSGKMNLSWKTCLGILGVVAIYGAVDELSQWFVPGRTAEVLDWVADVAGASFALILLAGANRLTRHRI